jgi:hypothetical protein
MLDVRIFYTTLYIETNFSYSFCTIMYIGKYCSCFPLNPFIECECRNSP